MAAVGSFSSFGEMIHNLVKLVATPWGFCLWFESLRPTWKICACEPLLWLWEFLLGQGQETSDLSISKPQLQV